MVAQIADHPRTARPAHPGIVTFVASDGRTTIEPADRLPEWVKFAQGPDGAVVPVVRVVHVDAARGHTVRSYGEDGRLVGVTVPVAQTPPPARPTPRVAKATPTGWF